MNKTIKKLNTCTCIRAAEMFACCANGAKTGFPHKSTSDMNISAPKILP